ncbi:GNAT family N-acetyltransferase [Lysobacter enzymogenes]|uniref:GNAT family N-acetyltransferase n=1 Tax=Lysobacter enzymogenes TaxID=69 RepID=UPI001A95CD21|nr:GNAT family N-acetyltransferase [Lysobacter enzymogenes]QQP95396.1 GNAT family N-acetyltransferase [Lysobacter enzymogenes]
MSISIQAVDALERIGRREYEALYAASRASLFYDWRFLHAAERSPLLPVEKTVYLCAYDDGELCGVLPAYLQRLAGVDPLGLLAASAGVRDGGGELGLFSHVMHCWDTGVPCLEAASGARERLLRALLDAAAREGARYAGLLNVEDPALFAPLRACGLTPRPLVERYDLDLARFDDFEQLLRALPSDGRGEMRRQLRKFEASAASARVLAPPFDDTLETVCGLCFATTARRGTPHYFPAAPLARFVRLCGELARVIVIESDGAPISGMICYQSRDAFYLWSAGVVYDRCDFSPYTVGFAAAYRYAFAAGLRRVEGGRLNERIKRRLGLSPSTLYSALAPLPRAGAVARTAPHARASAATASVD